MIRHELYEELYETKKKTKKYWSALYGLESVLAPKVVSKFRLLLPTIPTSRPTDRWPKYMATIYNLRGGRHQRARRWYPYFLNELIPLECDVY